MNDESDVRVTETEKPRNEKIKKMIGVIVVVVLGLIGSVGGGAWVFGDKEEPESPRDRIQQRDEYTEDAPPVPALYDGASKPITVRLVAPREATAGDLIDIHANVDYDAQNAQYCGVTYSFVIVPPVDGLKWRPNEPDALFANRDAGEYILFVAAAGPNGEVASDWRSITLLPNTVEIEVPVPVEVAVPTAEGEQPEVAVPHIEPQKIQLASPGMNDFTLEIERLALQVNTPEILPQIKVVATALRNASTATMSNQLNGKKPLQYAVDYASAQLGDASAAWTPFFEGVDTLLTALRVLGIVGDQETEAMALADAATTLEQAGPN